MDHGEASTHPLDLDTFLESLSEIQPKESESSFAKALLNSVALNDFIEGIRSLTRGVNIIPTNQYEGKPGSVCAFEVEVEFDEKNKFKVIEKDSSRKNEFLSRRKTVPRVFLIHSDSIYVVDAKWAVYKEFQRHIDSDNIYLQHTYEDYEEVTKVCAVHLIRSFGAKVKSIKEAVPVDNVSAIVNDAAVESLSWENIRKSCREIVIISEGENVGKVGSGSYQTRSMFTVKRLKRVLLEETLKKIAEDLSSEICKGILKHIQSKVLENLGQSFERIDISISDEDFQTVVVVIGAIIVSIFMPLVGIIFAVFTFVYTVIVPVEINSSSWRNKVADEIYENVSKQKDQILRKVKAKVEELCRKTVADLEKSHELLENEKSQIKLAFQNVLAKEWEERENLQRAVDVNKYPSILNFIVGRKFNSKSATVVKVFLEYDDDEAELSFKENISKEVVFEFVNVTEKSREGNKDIEKIQSLEEKAPAIDRYTRKRLSEFITKKAKSIYANYSNVISIGMSPVRSDGTNKACITLYCLDKDLIPYGEKPLPKSLGGYPCDIREDFIQLGYCEDCNVFDAGCSIGRHFVPSAGSAGFLVKSNLESVIPLIGFLTAAHVAVAEYKELYKQKKRLSECSILGSPYSVVHPSWKDSDDSDIVGNVIDSFCGNRGGVGMDAAFVKVNQPRVRGKEGRNANKLLSFKKEFNT